MKMRPSLAAFAARGEAGGHGLVNRMGDGLVVLQQSLAHDGAGVVLARVHLAPVGAILCLQAERRATEANREIIRNSTLDNWLPYSVLTEADGSTTTVYYPKPTDGEKITVNADNSLNIPDNPIIPFIEGDGIGVDITPVMQRVVNAAVELLGESGRYRYSEALWPS